MVENISSVGSISVGPEASLFKLIPLRCAADMTLEEQHPEPRGETIRPRTARHHADAMADARDTRQPSLPKRPRRKTP